MHFGVTVMTKELALRDFFENRLDLYCRIL